MFFIGYSEMVSGISRPRPLSRSKALPPDAWTPGQARGDWVRLKVTMKSVAPAREPGPIAASAGQCTPQASQPVKSRPLSRNKTLPPDTWTPGQARGDWVWLKVRMT